MGRWRDFPAALIVPVVAPLLVICLLHGAADSHALNSPLSGPSLKAREAQRDLSRLERLLSAQLEELAARGADDLDEDEDEEEEDLVHDVEGHETDATLIEAYPVEAVANSQDVEPDHRRKVLELSIICIASCKRKLSKYGDPAYILHETVKEMDFRLQVIEISAVIVYMEIWDEDLFDFSSGTLGPVRQYRAEVINPRVRSDVTVLFSGSSIPTKNGKRVGGKSGIGKACLYNESAIVLKHGGKNIGYAGMTLTHEMSHNLGITHASDACCPERNCMMGKGGGTGKFYVYSNCSMVKHNKWLKEDGQCLYDMPQEAYVPPGVDSCGNGFKEDWEQCDCGAGCLHGCCDMCHQCRMVEPIVEIEEFMENELWRRGE